MLKLRQKLFLCAALFWLLFTISNTANAQEISINYTSRIELLNATEPPKILAFPEFKYPDEARKNGVEGTIKIILTLAKTGTVENVWVEQNLPHGVTEAVINSLKELRFQPARKDGEPVDTKMTFNIVVAIIYDEFDKNVGKPKIIEKPAPVYPENHKTKAIKGKVYVGILVSADGGSEVIGVRSVMPKEFDVSAMEAAKKIKFQPAVHKKSKKAVSQKITVEYDFQP